MKFSHHTHLIPLESDSSALFSKCRLFFARARLMLAITIVLFIVSLAFPSKAPASEPDNAWFSEMEKEDKLLAANAGGLLFLTTWGIINWDYGQHPPQFKAEHWFGQDTKTGGADKLGHFHSTYVLSHYMSHLCHSWGYSEERAALYGSLSAFGLLGFVEFGDSFSNFGFSHEDFIMNTAGAIVGYLTKRYPGISEKLDLRIEYTPTFEQFDVLTDYDHMKFLAAIKLDGFKTFKNSYLKYLEIHLGYYTRDFSGNESDAGRYLYGGIGINLSRIFSNLNYRRTATTLRYLQIPYTDIQFKRKLQNQ